MSIFKTIWRYRGRHKRRRSDDRIMDAFSYLAAIIVVGTVAAGYAYNGSVPDLLTFGTFLAAAILALCLKYGRRIWEKKRRIRKLITVSAMYRAYKDKPTDFEAHVAGIWKAHGFQVAVTPPSKDCGVDLFLRKQGRLYVGEVKLYAPGNKVSVEKIQKLHSAMVTHEAQGAVFISTSDFTSPAYQYAGRIGMTLINGMALQKMVEELKQKKNRKARGFSLLGLSPKGDEKNG